MADESREDAEKMQDGHVDFVHDTLGRWSSHPEMLGWQRKIFRLIGFLPVVIGVAIALLILTNYRALDFANVHDIPTMCSALGVLVGRCWIALLALLCALCVTWGFSITVNTLWGASRKVSMASPRECANRDEMPIPMYGIAMIAMFWLLPVMLPLFKGLIMAVDARLYWGVVVLSNICCFLPFVLLRIWLSVGADQENLFKEGRRHPYTQLFAWLAYLVLAIMVFSVPDFPPLTKFVDGPFATHVNTHCPWVLKVLDVTVPVLFRWCRVLLALYLLWKSVVHFLKWRLQWVPRRKSKERDTDDNEEPVPDVDVDRNDVAEAVKRISTNLPPGVTLDGDISLVGQDPAQTSQSDQSADSLGIQFLIDLPEGELPTLDQRNFFDRFVFSYEESRNLFLDNEDPRRPQAQSDLILHGPVGSGRTTILMAAALYAAAVRGQRVLYVVSSRKVAGRLAKRINDRLRALMVDCYFSAGVLKSLDVDCWLEAYSRKPDENGAYHFDGTEKIPPDVLFATPEMIERCFFSNGMTLDVEKRDAMRRLLVGFGLFVIDDFLEYPVAVRSHLAFLMDKFRLLLAAECAVPQFVVATTPLDTQNSIDLLGQRLFGFNRFNRNQNVYEIRLRQVEPYQHGTLVVDRCKTLAETIRELLKESLIENGLKTLLYHEGVSSCERAKLDEEFKEYVSDDRLRIIGCLDELEDQPTCDIVFIVSSASDNAAVALRLNMPKDVNPTFFSIKMDGLSDESGPNAIVLLPAETALSLRAFHLKSVLQYISPLTPVEASIWSTLGVFGNHPYNKDVNDLEDSATHVTVQWYQDDLPASDRYAEGQIWPYLVLATNAAISTRGQLIDFTVLPNAYERIWVDRKSEVTESTRLLLMKDVESGVKGAKDNAETEVRWQRVSWRDSKNVPVGETDLAHTEEMVYRRRGDEEKDDEEYTVSGLRPREDVDQGSERFALAVTARYRRGTEEEYLFPVRRFSWSIPTRNMEVLDLCSMGGLGWFTLQLKDDLVYQVNGLLKGLLNLRGQEQDYYPPRTFGYDSYMSCIVLEPTFKRLTASASPEEYVRKCMNGKWTTSMSEGFSPALTHALTAAFRQRFSGWSFFAMAPAFFIEGRQDSVGKVVVWIVEPANSGRTASPVIKSMLEDSAFWVDLLERACAILAECSTIWELRMRSKLAFVDETLDEDDLAKALAVLESVRDSRKAPESTDGEDVDETGDNNDGDEDAEGGGTEDGDKDGDDGAGEPEHRNKSSGFSEEEKEFEKVVLSALHRFEDSIDVTNTAYARAHFNKPDMVSDLFDDILWNHPEIFYISKSHHYTRTWLSDGTIKSFVIHDIAYGITREQYQEAKAELDNAVGNAMKYLWDHVAGTDVEMVLKSLCGQKGISELADEKTAEAMVAAARYLHDYIIKTCEYDVAACETNDTSPAARTAYSVLVRHLAVCEGYAMAYRYLLDKLGIKSEEVISEEMAHCWNYVQIGGNWYHVDVTWDDPVYQGRKPDDGRVSHENFLLSDGAICMRPRNAKDKHHSWDVRGLPAADNEEFDNRDWDK